MSNTLDSLSDDEVRQITLLVETLDRSAFDYLQVEVGSLKVTIGKGTAPPGLSTAGATGGAAPGAQADAPRAAAVPAGIPVALHGAVPAVISPAPSAQALTNEAPQDGTVTIVAPLMGRFYAKPEPGAAPFVSVGAEVNPDATVGLIEVMKVFTAVRAGVRGVVTEICVQDAEFIEYGRVLFRVRLAATASGAGAGGAKGPRKGTRA